MLPEREELQSTYVTHTCAAPTCMSTCSDDRVTAIVIQLAMRKEVASLMMLRLMLLLRDTCPHGNDTSYENDDGFLLQAH